MHQWPSFRDLVRRCLVVACSAVVLVACGGGGGGGGAATTPPATSPLTLRFDTVDPVIAPGGLLYLNLRAENSDGSVSSVTSLATWSSSRPAVATVANLSATVAAGVVTGLADGRTDIVATYQGASATFSVTVATGLLRRIEVSYPEKMAIGIGGQFRFVATAHYTDGARFDDPTLTWTTSAPDVMRVSNEAGLRGTVTGVRPGTATITASKDGVSWSTDLSVLNIHSLGGRPYGAAVSGPDGYGKVRVDGSGRSLAFFGYVPIGPTRPAALFATQLSGSTDWNAATSMGAAALEAYATGRDMAMNEAGQAIVAWLVENRLFVARYSPLSGMGEAQLLTDTVSRQFSVAMGADGAGLVTWARLGPGFNSEIVYSRFDAGAAAWTTPAQVPGTELARGSAEPWRLVMNEAGQASLLWRRRSPMTLTPLPGDAAINALMVSRFEPGPAGGWQSAEVVEAQGGPATVVNADIAIGGAGHVAVGWMQETGFTPAGAIVAHVRTRRYDPATGWANLQDVVPSSPLSPTEARIAINDSGAAVLAWRTNWDNGLWISATQADGSWAAASSPFTPDLSLATGTPQVLRPAMTADGRALLAWRVDILGIRSNMLTLRYTPQGGWERLTAVPFVGRNFVAYDIDLHFNRAGRGTAVWVEGSGEGSSLYASSEFQF